MPKIIINLPLELERRIRAKIQAGIYESIDHFVRIALENQVFAEENEGSSWPNIVTESPSKQILPQQSRNQLQSVTLPIELEPQLLNAPEDSMLSGIFLWGQFYRFLPVKPALRVLAYQSQKTLPPLATFKEAACDVAQTIGSLLSNEDKRLGRKSGEKYSTSFPEPTVKSRRRYTEQYLVYVRTSDGKLDGMLACLKLINVTKDAGVYKVGLTEQGIKFARLPNPLLDSETKGAPLSEEETSFLIEHITKNLPNEALHMKVMLQLLYEGVTSRTELNSKMTNFYLKYKGYNNWSPAHINTMRAGLLSRMVEMGLIQKTKIGLEVKYRLSERGEKALNEELSGVN